MNRKQSIKEIANHILTLNVTQHQEKQHLQTK